MLFINIEVVNALSQVASIKKEIALDKNQIMEAFGNLTETG